MTFLGWLTHLKAVEKRRNNYPETHRRFILLDILLDLSRN